MIIKTLATIIIIILTISLTYAKEPDYKGWEIDQGLDGLYYVSQRMPVKELAKQYGKFIDIEDGEVMTNKSGFAGYCSARFMLSQLIEPNTLILSFRPLKRNCTWTPEGYIALITNEDLFKKLERAGDQIMNLSIYSFQNIEEEGSKLKLLGVKEIELESGRKARLPFVKFVKK